MRNDVDDFYQQQGRISTTTDGMTAEMMETIEPFETFDTADWNGRERTRNDGSPKGRRFVAVQDS